ncbi:hypothetical protein ACTXPB_16870 [Brachybacterium alimentarium]
MSEEPHNLDTAARANQILVLDKGRIVQYGAPPCWPRLQAATATW